MKYEKKIPLLRIRWLTVTCFEIQVGGKTIVTDPFIGLSPGTDMDVDAVEGADLITVTHLHWDHVTDIAPLMDKFGSSVLVGDLSAMDLAKYLNRNPRFLYPMAHNTELDFGWVKVRALMGRHTDAGKPFLDIATAFEQNKHFARYPKLAPLEYFGSLEYRNYLFTTPGGLKILLYGGMPCPEQLNLLGPFRPDVALLQFSRPIPQEIAQFAAALGAKILIPHHMDLSETADEYLPGAQELCAIFEEMSGGVGIVPQHGQWYDLDFRVAASITDIP